MSGPTGVVVKSLPLDPKANLVDLVAFKWLMAGRGWWVDVPRLQRDRAYACECARLARSSGLEALEAHADAVLSLGPHARVSRQFECEAALAS